MDLLSVQDEDSHRSGWLWALLALLLLLLLVGIWMWWSGSKPQAPPLAAKAAASSEVAMNAPPPPAPVATPAMSYDVQFGYHKTDIATNEALTGAVEAWRSANGQCGSQCSCAASARIDVVGHADRRTGTRAFNRCISWKRANAVADALAGLGVPRCDLTASFMGDADTPAPEPDEASAAKHRHASITIVAANAASKPSCDGACKSSLSAAEAQRCEAKLKEPPLLHLQ